MLCLVKSKEELFPAFESAHHNCIFKKAKDKIKIN